MFDPETRVLSGDFFKFLLDSEGKKALRYTYFFSIFSIELDQAAQTKILPTLADLIRQSIRNTDLIGRVNGQRFCVILHHIEAQNMYSVGERIRDRIGCYNFMLKKRESQWTVSIGGACFPTHTPDMQGLLLTADEMLQRAKSAGGNRVHLPKL